MLSVSVVSTDDDCLMCSGFIGACIDGIGARPDGNEEAINVNVDAGA